MDIKLNFSEAVEQQAGSTVAEILALAMAQRAKGVEKYGQGVEQASLQFSDWTKHAKEELIDFLVYIIQADAKYKQMQNELQKLFNAIDAAGIWRTYDFQTQQWNLHVQKDNGVQEHEMAFYVASDIFNTGSDSPTPDRITLHSNYMSSRTLVALRVIGEPLQEGDKA